MEINHFIPRLIIHYFTPTGSSSSLIPPIYHPGRHLQPVVDVYGGLLIGLLISATPSPPHRLRPTRQKKVPSPPHSNAGRCQAEGSLSKPRYCHQHAAHEISNRPANSQRSKCLRRNFSTPRPSPECVSRLFAMRVLLESNWFAEEG